jgi:hypothetical protein
VVLVQEIIHDWANHVGEEILSNEIRGILDHDEGKLDYLPHANGCKPVFMM